MPTHKAFRHAPLTFLWVFRNFPLQGGIELVPTGVFKNKKSAAINNGAASVLRKKPEKQLGVIEQI